MNTKGLTENFTRIYTPFFTLGSPVIPTLYKVNLLIINRFFFLMYKKCTKFLGFYSDVKPCKASGFSLFALFFFVKNIPYLWHLNSLSHPNHLIGHIIVEEYLF